MKLKFFAFILGNYFKRKDTFLELQKKGSLQVYLNLLSTIKKNYSII